MGVISISNNLLTGGLSFLAGVYKAISPSDSYLRVDLSSVPPMLKFHFAFPHDQSCNECFLYAVL